MRLRVPSLPGLTSVEDACILRRKDTDFGVLAHARGNDQLSIIDFNNLSARILLVPQLPYPHSPADIFIHTPAVGLRLS
jgi:hypothetical protein